MKCKKTKTKSEASEALASGLRKRSGEVDSRCKLVCFLYLLMRGYVNSGQVEEIMTQLAQSDPDTSYQFCNGYLAEHAYDIAERLLDTGATENEEEQDEKRI